MLLIRFYPIWKNVIRPALVSDYQGKNNQRKQGHDRQRCAKDISYEAGIFRPVHPELEFIDNPHHNTDRNIDQRQLAPEFCHPVEGIIPGLVIMCLHVSDELAETQGQGNE